MKTLMVLLIVVISLIMIQVDGFPNYDKENILGEKMDPIRKVEHLCSDKTLYPDGCCKDGKTDPNMAKWGKEGYSRDQACAYETCSDFGHDICKTKKDDCENPDTYKKCPFTCKKCTKHHASPKDECEQTQDAQHGCCWNGVPASGPNNEGCIPCQNLKSLAVCNMWKEDEPCDNGRVGIAPFLAKNCAELCGLC